MAAATPPQGAWGAPASTDPCGSESLLESRLKADPRLRERRELYERMLQAAQVNRMIPGKSARPDAQQVAPANFTIPVVVHIVHQGGPENISDAQVQSQLEAMNRDFANTPNSGAPAVDAGIQFCLATNLPPGSPVVWSTTPGITRDVSAETNHTFQNLGSETALKAISYLPSNRYLNIWVVGNISGGGGGVAGYATFPGVGPATLDGIVCRATAFGSNYTIWGNGFTLLPLNDDGKIMDHEVGHYLNLFHTFAGGCSFPGDYVADTPPESNAHQGCPISGLVNCTQVNDPIENFMDYTNDPCRWAFTAGQRTRMHAAIATWRSNLVGVPNLAFTGCPYAFSAPIVAQPTQACVGSSVAFSTPVGGFGYTYSWSFPGGSPAFASTQSVSVAYPAPGIYPVVLTITDGGPNNATNTSTVYVNSCSPIVGPCTNWVFGFHCAVSFATGMPVALPGTLVESEEASAQMSDNSGNLLFYTDGTKVFHSSGYVMPNSTGLLAGESAHNGVNIMKRPGSATQYYLFTNRQWQSGPAANPLTYSVVDMSLNGGLGDIPLVQKNLPVTLPGNPTQMLEATALIPHCNGVDYWMITHGAVSSSGKIYVTLVTSAGPGATTVYNLGMTVLNNAAGVLTPTADGTKFATINLNNGQVAAYNFDRNTGAVTTLLAPSLQGGWADAALSPDGKLLYYSYFDGTFFGVRQLKIATLENRTLIVNSVCNIKPGPDGRIYLGSGGNPAISCINFPNNFNVLDQNECGLNVRCIPMPAGYNNAGLGNLPNFVVQCNAAVGPAQFTYTQTGCVNLIFTSGNCAGPWNWNFGDGSGGSGQVVSHTYANQGTYTVTLSAPSASPSTQIQTVSVQTLPVTIAGASTACVSQANYSAIGPVGYTYTWFIAGGVPATAPGNNVDVTWGTNGGTVTLVAFDPLTGCSSQVTKNVGPCPVCVPPPVGMTAWWPLDEAAGAIALEMVMGNNAADANGPLHLNGMVSRARQFDGSSTFLVANSAPALNFGTGDMSVDAWVQTTSATGIRSIVDKSYTDPEVGYRLYLKNGRLAFRLGEVSGFSTEYYLDTTPFVADGQWHHVAAVEQRATSPTGTRLYVDGNLVANFPAFGAGLNISNSEKLLIGAGTPWNAPTNFITGKIDEVELFSRALGSSEVLGLVYADEKGKCKEFGYLPSAANFCAEFPLVALGMQLCNYTTSPQTYNVAFAPLPMGGPCTWTGPVIQMLTPNPVTVPAGSCVSVQYLVNKPPGMPFGTSTCYKATITNTGTLASFVLSGSVYAPPVSCISVVGPSVGVGSVGVPISISLKVRNTGTSLVALPYSLGVVPVGEASSTEAPTIRINGLDPGQPYLGAVVLGPGDSAAIHAQVEFTEPREFRFFDLVMSTDQDVNGTPQNLCSAGLYYRSEASTVPVAVPPTRPATFWLHAVVPNPTHGLATVSFELPTQGRVQLALYDIAGRRVRMLVDGVTNAGPGTFHMDTSELPQGVYFVRLRMNGGEVARRMVVVR